MSPAPVGFTSSVAGKRRERPPAYTVQRVAQVKIGADAAAQRLRCSGGVRSCPANRKSAARQVASRVTDDQIIQLDHSSQRALAAEATKPIALISVE